MVDVEIHADALVICKKNSPLHNFLITTGMMSPRYGVNVGDDSISFIIFDIDEVIGFLRMAEIPFKEVPVRRV